MTPNDVMALIKDKGIPAVDLRFIDLPGLWQHFTVSAKEFDLDAFENGVGFDGSSIRGFKQIQESDMLLFPDQRVEGLLQTRRRARDLGHLLGR